MNYYIYPAVSKKEEEARGYTVSFPDLPGCITYGDTIELAYKYAEDALSLFLDNEKKPKATGFDIIVKEYQGYVMFIKYQKTKNIKIL